MQKEAKSLLLPRLQTITNDPMCLVYETQIKIKEFIILQRIDLCEFQPKEAYTLAPVASSRWNSRTKTGKSKEMFATNKKNKRSKRLACSMGLEYGLRDSPCSTEWIGMRYKCTRDLVWKSMGPLHRYDACLYKRARNCSFKNRH